MAKTTITWWGCAAVEIDAGGRRLAIDPYLNPAAGMHYVCITHNDADHCDERTLRGLAADPAFERLMVPASTLVKTKLDSPTHGEDTDLAFLDRSQISVLYPKYTREPGRVHPGPTEIELDGFRIETVDTSERPLRYRTAPGAPFPSGPGPFVGAGQYPNLGYLITEEATGLTIYHPGDLCEIFDAHRLLRDRVDVMLFPSIKLAGLEQTIIDTIRPRLAIPIHHRLATPDFPIPLGIAQEDLEFVNVDTAMPKPGTSLEDWRRELHRLMAADWYPTLPQPALARMESVIPALAELGTAVEILEPARPYDLAGLVPAAAR
jgi:L-ascorbate metabolism protein UlaG (beta-lactamase superfamily)